MARNGAMGSFRAGGMEDLNDGAKSALSVCLGDPISQTGMDATYPAK
jgi:hypothetical protein